MRVAVIGSGSLNIDIAEFIPAEVSEIVFGASGIGTLAQRWADTNKIPKLVIGEACHSIGYETPTERDCLVIDLADYVLAIWDGVSGDTKNAIEYAQKTGKPVRVCPLP